MAEYNSPFTGAEVDAAVEDVQEAKSASSTDTTSGRLLKVGDFGVGQTGVNQGGNYPGILIPRTSSITTNESIVYILLGELKNNFQCRGIITGDRGVANTQNGVTVLFNISKQASDPTFLRGSVFSVGRNHTPRLVTCTYQTKTVVSLEISQSLAPRAAWFTGNTTANPDEFIIAASSDVSDVVELDSSGQTITGWPHTPYHTGNTIVDSGGFIKEA